MYSMIHSMYVDFTEQENEINIHGGACRWRLTRKKSRNMIYMYVLLVSKRPPKQKKWYLKVLDGGD
jgi:hypothetical protein